MSRNDVDRLDREAGPNRAGAAMDLTSAILGLALGGGPAGGGLDAAQRVLAVQRILHVVLALPLGDLEAVAGFVPLVAEATQENRLIAARSLHECISQEQLAALLGVTPESLRRQGRRVRERLHAWEQGRAALRGSKPAGGAVEAWC